MRAKPVLVVAVEFVALPFIFRIMKLFSGDDDVVVDCIPLFYYASVGQ